jgi:hypothetical protein
MEVLGPLESPRLTSIQPLCAAGPWPPPTCGGPAQGKHQQPVCITLSLQAQFVHTSRPTYDMWLAHARWWCYTPPHPTPTFKAAAFRLCAPWHSHLGQLQALLSVLRVVARN